MRLVCTRRRCAQDGAEIIELAFADVAGVHSRPVPSSLRQRERSLVAGTGAVDDHSATRLCRRYVPATGCPSSQHFQRAIPQRREMSTRCGRRIAYRRQCASGKRASGKPSQRPRMASRLASAHDAKIKAGRFEQVSPRAQGAHHCRTVHRADPTTRSYKLRAGAGRAASSAFLWNLCNDRLARRHLDVWRNRYASAASAIASNWRCRLQSPPLTDVMLKLRVALGHQLAIERYRRASFSRHVRESVRSAG